jgi:hypothetical protein
MRAGAKNEQLLYEADDGNHAEDAQLFPIGSVLNFVCKAV